MCCWHSPRLRCVSSSAVRHSSVTQWELLISHERDVLASALGSFEDKRRASPVRFCCYGERDETTHTGRFKGRHFSISYFASSSRSEPWCTRLVGVCTAEVWLHVEPRPLVNPLTFRAHSGRWKQPCDARVSQWKSYSMFWNATLWTPTAPHGLKWPVCSTKL